jgi:hypothetical protein
MMLRHICPLSGETPDLRLSLVDLAGRCVNRLPVLQAAPGIKGPHSLGPSLAASGFRRVVHRAVIRAVKLGGPASRGPPGRVKTHHPNPERQKCRLRLNDVRRPSGIKRPRRNLRPSADMTRHLPAISRAVRQLLGEAARSHRTVDRRSRGTSAGTSFQ